MLTGPAIAIIIVTAIFMVAFGWPWTPDGDE